MGFTNRIYSLMDLVVRDLDKTPSLDLPDLVTERCYTPRDNGKYMLFFANVKKSVRPEMCPVCKEKTPMVHVGRSKPRLVHDVIRNNYRVDIMIQPNRLLCKKCKQKFTPSIRA